MIWIATIPINCLRDLVTQPEAGIEPKTQDWQTICTTTEQISPLCDIKHVWHILIWIFSAEGIYRVNTEFYTNITAYSGTISVPEGCTPEESSQKDHIQMV